MKSFNKVLAFLCFFLLGVAITVAGVLIYLQINRASASATGECAANVVYFGDVSLAEYHIEATGKAGDAAKLLSQYIQSCTGDVLAVSKKPTDGPAIRLIIDAAHNSDLPLITIESGTVSIIGKNLKELKKQVSIFANAYLGLAFAGEDREHFPVTSDEIHNPDSVYYNEDGAYISKREPIIVLWNPSMTRGAFYNANTLKKSDILSYSNDALYTYVKMMRALGYTGIQVTDMCSAWAEFGNYEYVHQKIRYMADAAHSLGMDFTLWVWGSEFNGYGWNDQSVVYNDPAGKVPFLSYKDSYDTYNKYYDIYADLADCSDRLIVHYFEPGHVGTTEDVAALAKLIKDKFRAINPDINVGINVYSRYFDMEALCNALGDDRTDFTYYTLAVTESADTISGIRYVCLQNALNYGIWSWGIIEREIDQVAMLSVNAREIKDTYLKTMALDNIVKPEYWSEMESYHMGNIFSLYVAGALLQNPELDADTLLYEAAKAMVGEEYADDLYKVLTLIQKARVGDTRDSFYEGESEYVFLDGPNPTEIVKESDEALTILHELIDADIQCSTVPLAIPASDILEMMLPHVKQIQEYAEFRLNYNKLVDMAKSGENKEALSAFISEFFTPVCEYNVVTGIFGVEEQRMQVRLIEEFCTAYELEEIDMPLVDYYRKQRIFGEMISLQQASSELVKFSESATFQLDYAFGTETSRRLVSELVDEGVLTRLDDGNVYITDWKRYTYNY